MKELLRRVHRRRSARLTTVFLLCLVAVGVAGTAVRAVGDSSPLETRQDFEQRGEQLLRAHSDSLGRVRPDLWRRAMHQFARLPVSAAWHRGNVSGAALQDPGQAPAGGVVGAQWQQIGPAPLVIDAEHNFQGDGPDTGEIVDVAIDPRGSTDQTIYVATNGGVWKTPDGGSHWSPLTDNQASLSIGALVLDPANPSIVYAGTGNRYDGSGQFFGQNPQFNGVGILKSTDGGGTWTTVGANRFTGRGITRMVMPAANVLLVATSSGLFKSVDGGLNFGSNSPNFNNGNAVLGGYITALSLDTASSTTVWTGVSGSGLFKSVNSGTSWGGNSPNFDDGNPLFAPSGSFSDLAFGQSTSPDNQELFLNVANPSGGGFGATYFGLFRSTDGGANWTQIQSAVPAGDSCFCSYGLFVVVDPQDNQTVWQGFINEYVSTDAGGSFSRVGGDNIHDDQHALVFPPSTHFGGGGAPTKLWVGTDGGLAYTTNRGANWTSLPGVTGSAMATNLFFQIDIGRAGASDAAGYSYGGTQDTGEIAHKPSHSGTEWHLHEDGDGGAIATDPNNPQVAYMGGNRCYKKTTNGGDSWAGLPGVPMGVCAGQLAIDPNNGSNVFLASAGTLYRSTTGGGNLTSIFTAPGGANITDIDTVKIDSNILWLGLTDGKVTRVTNALGSASGSTVSVTGAPAQAVAGVAVDPTDSTRAVVVYPGFNGVVSGVSKHVFLTTDSGSSWTNISGVAGGAQNLPDIPLHSVVIDAGTAPHSVIVSTDAGVARTVDGGGTWQQLGVGLPRTLSKSLQLNAETDPPVLRIGTYGRSVFELASPTGPQLAVNTDLGFGNVGLGQRATRIVQVFNVGTADLHISAFSRLSGDPDFTIFPTPPTPTTIQPGEELDFTIQFQPIQRGNRSAIFHIQSDDPSQPDYQLPASGTGVTGRVAVSGSLEFGVVPRGMAATRPLTVTNTGLAPLTVSDVALTGGSDSAFTVLSNPGTPQTIQPSDSVVFTVRFAPPSNSNGNLRSGTVRVSSDDPDAPNVDVAATGIPGVPRATLDSSAFDFGGVPVDNRTTPHVVNQVLRIANQASCALCDLTITSLPITGPAAGDFTVVGAPAPPFTIGAGNHVDLTIRFNPPVGGTRNASLAVNSDDPANPSLPVSLVGEGLLPAIASAPGTPTSPLIFSPTVYDPNCGIFCGQTKVETFTNTGQAELIADVVSFSGSPAFSGPGPSSPPDRFAQGTSLVEPVTFRPTAAARKLTGTLTVRDNLPFDSTTVERQVPLCGEAVGRGVRVLLEDASGNPVPTVAALHLYSTGTSPNVNVNVANLPLQQIDPPTSCQTIRFHYENQALPATEETAPKSSYYTIDISAGGNRKATITFTLAPNQFRELVMVVDNAPPLIIAPKIVRAFTSRPDGTRVRFRVRAVDKHDGRVAVRCAPASGRFFRLGTTRVTCRAHDRVGHKAVRRFRVVVRHRR